MGDLMTCNQNTNITKTSWKPKLSFPILTEVLISPKLSECQCLLVPQSGAHRIIAVTTANKGGKEGQGGAKLVFSCGENGLCPPCRWAHPL